MYGNQLGISMNNSFGYYNSSQVGAYSTSAFTYWTDRIAPDPADPARGLPIELLNSGGQNVQPPWVPFVKAGCNFSAVSTVDTVLENNGNDINQVFGAGSPEASESPAQRNNDFVGIAVHCADLTCGSVGNGSGAHAKSELGGQGFAALYGHPAQRLHPLEDCPGGVPSQHAPLSLQPGPANEVSWQKMRAALQQAALAGATEVSATVRQ